MKTKSEVYWEQFWKTQKNTIYNKEVNSWYDVQVESILSSNDKVDFHIQRSNNEILYR